MKARSKRQVNSGERPVGSSSILQQQCHQVADIDTEEAEDADAFSRRRSCSGDPIQRWRSTG